ncbi:MAG: cysteine desulfurase [Planctomycetota bacterium]
MSTITSTVSGLGTPVVGDTLDVERVRRDFPALLQSIDGEPLVYLDNAATTQKPNSVIEAVERFYRKDNANIHRGVHRLSQRATEAYEAARGKVARFIGANRPEEIIFVRGATEAINLVAQTFGRARLDVGDEVLITHMEHHANIVPWQMLCKQVGARLRVAPINDHGELVIEDFERLLGSRTKLVSIAHVSNALGTINPIQGMIALAHARNIPVMVDGAQAVPHMKVDVQALDADFYVFSGHKAFGPTGIGVFCGKYELLKRMPPYQGGGDMITSVTFEKTTYAAPPRRFEAGTPHIAGAIGLGAAIDYLEAIGLEAITAYEGELLAYATEALSSVPEIRLIGTARKKAGVLSFTIDGVHPHDAGTILDQQGIAVRAGHHCAQPVMQRFGVPATVRASLAFYNTKEEIDILLRGIRKVIEVFH